MRQVRVLVGAVGTIVATAIVTACGGSKAPETPAPAAPPQLAFEKYTLPNGLDVILSEDHRLPLVAVNVWYHVGPANEAAGRTGFAHLFEHMMFQGSKHVPGDSHFKWLEAAGASDANGTTNFDRTNYYETLPANQLALGLWLESDRMGYLLDSVDEAKLDEQQRVVRKERQQSHENVPYGAAGEAVFHTLFPQGHPYYANVIGSHADIQAAKLGDVKEFFKQYYRPNNASLAIAGDFDKAQAKQLVEKYFGPLKRGPDVPKVNVTTPAITAEKKITVQDRVELPRVYLTWITPAFFTPGDADADLTANILGGGNASRLYKKLVYEKQIAQDVAAFQQSMALGSAFQIVATARPGHKAEELEAAITEELGKLQQSGPDDRELERARNTFETQMISSLEVVGSVADTLNMFNQYVGDPAYLPKYLTEHRQVTAASVKAFAQNYLKRDARIVVYSVSGRPDWGPAVPVAPPFKGAKGTGAESVNGDESWRADKPAPAAAKPVQLPTPTTYTLSNGLTVIYNERSGLPMTAAALVIGSGGDSNPPDRPGLANFVAAMLDQGTATRDANKIADDAAQIGASLGAASAKDAVTVSVSALTSNFPAAVDLLADIALHPNFPQAEIDRQRQSRLASFVEQRQDPSTVAAMVTLRGLYGSAHPYGYIELGSEDATRATTRDDLVGFWQRTFAPSNAALIIAGTVPAAEMKGIVEKMFGAWKAGQAPAPSLGAGQPTDARVLIVDKPGTVQTQVYVSTIGAARSTPDFAATSVMNAILGGLFSSRINLNLREAHGYTYGASSQFVFRKTPGPFWIQSGVETASTAQAVAEIFKEIKRMITTQVTPEELAMGKDSIARSLPADFETSARAAGSLLNLYLYKLGLDYYSKLPGEIDAVTAAAVQAAAAKYLVADKMLVVAVGDREKIEKALTALNLGKVELRHADGSGGK
jgi:zinc protease